MLPCVSPHLKEIVKHDQCEVLNASLLNVYALDTKEHYTQVREDHDSEQYKKVDREEAVLRALNTTVGKKSKRNL